MAGKDWGWEEKGMTEDEMVGWHHWLNGHGFGHTPGVGDGQGRPGVLWSMGLQSRTVGSNPSLLYHRQILYSLSHQGSTKNTGVGSVPFSRGSSWPQGSNRLLQHCQQILYPLSYQWTLHGKMALQINWIQRGKWLVISELCQKTGLWNIGQELLCGWKWLR